MNLLEKNKTNMWYNTMAWYMMLYHVDFFFLGRIIRPYGKLSLNLGRRSTFPGLMDRPSLYHCNTGTSPILH